MSSLLYVLETPDPIDQPIPDCQICYKSSGIVQGTSKGKQKQSLKHEDNLLFLESEYVRNQSLLYIYITICFTSLRCMDPTHMDFLTNWVHHGHQQRGLSSSLDGSIGTAGWVEAVVRR